MQSSSDATQVTLQIDGMSCGHCVAAVRSALEEIPGVTVGEVEIGAATVTLDPAVASPTAAVEAIRDAGYDAQVTDGPPPVKSAGVWQILRRGTRG